MPNNPDKGHFKGSCNRADCQRPGALFQHKDNQQHYCWNCAHDINGFAIRDDKVDLFPVMKFLHTCYFCQQQSVCITAESDTTQTRQCLNLACRHTETIDHG